MSLPLPAGDMLLAGKHRKHNTMNNTMNNSILTLSRAAMLHAFAHPTPAAWSGSAELTHKGLAAGPWTSEFASVSRCGALKLSQKNGVLRLDDDRRDAPSYAVKTESGLALAVGVPDVGAGLCEWKNALALPDLWESVRGGADVNRPDDALGMSLALGKRSHGLYPYEARDWIVAVLKASLEATRTGTPGALPASILATLYLGLALRRLTPGRYLAEPRVPDALATAIRAAVPLPAPQAETETERRMAALSDALAAPDRARSRLATLVDKDVDKDVADKIDDFVAELVPATSYYRPAITALRTVALSGDWPIARSDDRPSRSHGATLKDGTVHTTSGMAFSLAGRDLTPATVAGEYVAGKPLFRGVRTPWGQILPLALREGHGVAVGCHRLLVADVLPDVAALLPPLDSREDDAAQVVALRLGLPAEVGRGVIPPDDLRDEAAAAIRAVDADGLSPEDRAAAASAVSSLIDRVRAAAREAMSDRVSAAVRSRHASDLVAARAAIIKAEGDAEVARAEAETLRGEAEADSAAREARNRAVVAAYDAGIESIRNA